MPYTLTHTQELAQNSMVRSSMKKPTIMDVCKEIVESIQQDADIDIFANYVCATCLKSFNGSSKPDRCSCGSFNIRVPCVNAKSLRIAIKKIRGGNDRTIRDWKENLEDFGFMREINQYAYSFSQSKKYFITKKLNDFGGK